MHGPGKAQHDKAEAGGAVQRGAAGRQGRGRSNPTPENKARHARLVAAFKAYHNLPTEHDAFGTESSFEESWDDKHP